MDESKREEIALFRYGILLPFLTPDEFQWGMKGEMRRRLAAEYYDIPHSQKHRIDEETIRKWLAAYKKSGVDGLKPKSRSDRGEPRKISPESFERASALRTEAPGRSVRKIIQIMEATTSAKRAKSSAAPSPDNSKNTASIEKASRPIPKSSDASKPNAPTKSGNPTSSTAPICPTPTARNATNAPTWWPFSTTSHA